MDEDLSQGPDFLRALGIVVASEGAGSASLLRNYEWDCAVVPISFGDSGLVVAIPADERREFLESAERIIVDRASFIDHAPEHHDDLSFVEQPLDIIDKDHALHSFAAWPDRHAARGKDFAF